MQKRKKIGGRVKGTPNKKTADVINRAERILRLIETKYFDKDIAKISSAQRMILYSDMLEYVAPKLSRQEINGSINNKISLEIVRTITTSVKHTPSITAESN